MKKILILLMVCIAHLGFTQTTEDIDGLFTEFDDNHPAVSALVIHKGKVIYQKAFGSTHLDHKIPSTVDTKFQLGGLSKHFTSFAVFLLEERGKLDFNDDIRKYISDLPKYDDTITIDHLLSQTNGLPDFWTLKNIAGWHRDDVFTQAHALELIKQSKPGFKPGEDYIYSNTNSLLLAEIIAQVSGKSYAQFLKEELFEPLDMTNTVVLDDFEQFIPNVAASYERTEDGFKRSSLNYGIVGPTNVYSSISDLAKWELNLLNPKVGSKKLVERFYTDCKLNDGKTLNPLFGRITYAQQLLHGERGIPKYYQTGTLGGYASSIFKFMENELTVIVLSSGVGYNGYFGMQTANLFLSDIFTEPASIDFAALKTKKLSAKQLASYSGIYWNKRSGYSRTIRVKDDTLRYVRSWGESALLPLGKDKFQMVSGGDEKISVSFNKSDEGKSMSFIIGDSAPIYFTLEAPFSYNAKDLERFTGTYYCTGLSTVFEIVVEEGMLIAKNLKSGTITLKPIKEGLFEADQWYLRGIQFKESGSNIEGFTLSLDEVRGLWFEKV